MVMKKSQILGSFPKPLILKHLKNMTWELVEPFEYHSKKYGIVKVPVKFKTDLASIPKIFWSIIGSPNGSYGSGSVIHDWLYSQRELPRKKCDLIFLESMKVLKVPFWKQRVIYRALRLFGWIKWNSKAYRKEKGKPS